MVPLLVTQGKPSRTLRSKIFEIICGRPEHPAPLIKKTPPPRPQKRILRCGSAREPHAEFDGRLTRDATFPNGLYRRRRPIERET
jgi:hypothetical protein